MTNTDQARDLEAERARGEALARWARTHGNVEASFLGLCAEGPVVLVTIEFCREGKIADAETTTVSTLAQLRALLGY
jgi:hypothetical protein